MNEQDRSKRIVILRLEDSFQIRFHPDPSKFEIVPYNSPQEEHVEDFAISSLELLLSESLHVVKEILDHLSEKEKEELKKQIDLT